MFLGGQTTLLLGQVKLSNTTVSIICTSVLGINLQAVSSQSVLQYLTPPTGPFTDIGKPLIQGTLTEPQAHDHDDIDPTVWVENVDGVEHRYLAWG